MRTVGEPTPISPPSIDCYVSSKPGSQFDPNFHKGLPASKHPVPKDFFSFLNGFLDATFE